MQIFFMLHQIYSAQFDGNCGLMAIVVCLLFVSIICLFLQADMEMNDTNTDSPPWGL